MDALSNACDCYKRIRALYHAGKMLDQAALLSKEFGEFKQVNHFASRGAMLYRQGLLILCAFLISSLNFVAYSFTVVRPIVLLGFVSHLFLSNSVGRSFTT